MSKYSKEVTALAKAALDLQLELAVASAEYQRLHKARDVAQARVNKLRADYMKACQNLDVQVLADTPEPIIACLSGCHPKEAK